MTNTQITLFQLDNYGPWTVTPEPRREPDLQSLQSNLYADICDFVGAHGGYAFFTRFDNMVAVTNGLTYESHSQLQESLGNRYPVTVSAAFENDPNPSVALSESTLALQNAGSAQDDSRQTILVGDSMTDATRSMRDVCIAHFDVINATEKLTDNLDAFESFLTINQTYKTLAEHLYHEYNSLAFFVGGDNIIAVCRNLDTEQFRSVLQHVSKVTGTKLQVGVGMGPTAVEAGQTAKTALETCRTQERKLVVGGGESTDQIGSATSRT